MKFTIRKIVHPYGRPLRLLWWLSIALLYHDPELGESPVLDVTSRLMVADIEFELGGYGLRRPERRSPRCRRA